MKDLLSWKGISRQGAHQGIRRLGRLQKDVLETIEQAKQIRTDHPRMGCRDMYYAVRDKMPRGRDWSEQVLLSSGFRVKTPTRSFTEA